MGTGDLPVIVNRAGGTASRAGRSLAADLEEAFAHAGTRPRIELVAGEDLAATFEAHADAPRIAVGGGDGTIASAAHFAADRGLELAVLPLGTRNHFARQLGIPLDLTGAARVAATGAATAIDLGDCGGETFINNASAGAYVDLVREREHSPLPKYVASAIAAVGILRHMRPHTYTLTIDGERREVVTPMLFVGNNRYEIAEGHPGERDSLTDGKLSVFALAPFSFLALLWHALRTLVSRPDMHTDFVLDRLARELVIEGEGPFEIALDGERKSLAMPLTLRVRPGALRVVAPPHNHG